MALAVVLVTTSFGTAWTSRTAGADSHVDPSLRAGEVALVHTTSGNAGALSLTLSGLGAADVETDAAADTVIARLSTRALDALASDPTVTVATSDTLVMATGDDKNGKLGFEDDPIDLSRQGTRRPLASLRVQGAGVTVAVMDTGIADHPDLPRGKIRARVDFVGDGNTLEDPGGHGTFLAGVIAANGAVKGVAPDAELVSLRVLNASGVGRASDVVRAFNWLLQHRIEYAISVLNISWGAPQASSYQRDLLAALAESAWFSGVTVVVAAGNNGASDRTVTSPGNDPFVVTAGSYTDQGTVALADDTESSFSSDALTLDGFAKPDTLALGEHVLGLRVRGLSYVGSDGKAIGSATDKYVHMSGTSASAAYVSGVAALVKSAHRSFTPTEVKGAIVASGRALSGSARTAVDPAAALVRMTTVNVGLAPSRLLLALLTHAHQLRVAGVTWERVTWDGITWETISWETVRWESVSWETVTWEGVAWEKVRQW